ncbi:MAG: hypothetical protein ABID61_04925 [Candidatus Micrarchaeota archaeon]
MDSKKILDPISDTIELVKSDFFNIYKKMAMLEVTAMFIVIIAIIIAMLPFLVGVINFTAPLDWIIIAVVILFAIIVIVIGAFIANIIESIKYNVARDSYNKKETNMVDKFGENAWPIIKYDAFMFLISFVLMLPFLVIYFVLISGAYVVSMGASTDILARLVELLFRIVMTIVSAIISFFLQFAIFEIIIGKNGTIESIKRSYQIVRNNFIETFIFSLLLGAITSAVGIALMIIIVIIIGILFVIGFLLSTVLSGIALALVVSILVIIGLVIIVAVSAVSYTISIPCRYQYWKGIRK